MGRNKTPQLVVAEGFCVYQGRLCCVRLDAVRRAAGMPLTGCCDHLFTVGNPTLKSSEVLRWE